MQEAVQLMRLAIGRIVMLCGEVDGGLEGDGSVPLQGIRSVIC